MESHIVLVTVSVNVVTNDKQSCFVTFIVQCLFIYLFYFRWVKDVNSALHAVLFTTYSQVLLVPL